MSDRRFREFLADAFALGLFAIAAAAAGVFGARILLGAG
jgi:hypothetical protein